MAPKSAGFDSIFSNPDRTRVMIGPTPHLNCYMQRLLRLQCFSDNDPRLVYLSGLLCEPGEPGISKQIRTNTMNKRADKMQNILKGIEPGIDIPFSCRRGEYAHLRTKHG